MCFLPLSSVCFFPLRSYIIRLSIFWFFLLSTCLFVVMVNWLSSKIAVICLYCLMIALMTFLMSPINSDTFITPCINKIIYCSNRWVAIHSFITNHTYWCFLHGTYQFCLMSPELVLYPFLLLTLTICARMPCLIF